MAIAYQRVLRSISRCSIHRHVKLAASHAIITPNQMGLSLSTSGRRSNSARSEGHTTYRPTNATSNTTIRRITLRRDADLVLTRGRR